MADFEPTSETTGESTDDGRALLSRLHVIEGQDLDQRAAAFTQIHEQLRSTLEGGDASQHHG